MTRRLLVLALAAAMTALWAGSSAAVEWSWVGASGFSQAGSMQDWSRIRLNSIAVDAQGNIYATANNAENGTYTYPPASPESPNTIPDPVYNFAAGGLTIFTTGGSTINVQVSDTLDPLYPTLWWGPEYDQNSRFPQHRADPRCVGAITRLVTAGDGAVYGLMNWTEISWGYQRQNQRIVRVEANGAITPIWSEPAWVYKSAPSGASPVETPAQIRGIAVGGDGNVYWTMNGADSYWKFHKLWRYNVALGQVEEAPSSTPIPGEFSGNNGWGETFRMFDLVAVGDDEFVVFSQSSDGAAWNATYLSWTQYRLVPVNSSSMPGWGRDWLTAAAYDPVRKKLWAGGRGTSAGSPWKFFANGGSASVVDGAVQVVKGEQTYFRLDLRNTAAVVSAGARFKLVSASADFDGTLVQLRAPGNCPIIGIAASGGSYVLRDQTGQLAVLAPIVEDEYNDVHLSLHAATNTVECWWNGVKKYDGPAMPQSYYNWAGALFGAAVRDGGSAGTAIAAFDWFGCAETRVTPDDQWPDTLGYYLDGSVLPTSLSLQTNVMSRWNGKWFNEGLFETPYRDGTDWFVHGIVGADAWHANNNDPNVSGVLNGGHYWLSALAVNPADGTAWMSWGSQSSYNHDEIGTVWTRDLALNYGSQGVPEAGAQVVGLTFAGGKVYALTCNLATGAYNVYSADAPSPQPTSIGALKQGPAGLLYQTDSPKLVTYPDPIDPLGYFYIQEDDRSSGIKVIPALGQPTAKFGQRASVSGFVSVENGEAVIYAFSVVTQPTTDEIKPLATVVRNVGGNQLGIQPATLSGGSDVWGFPQCLNTTGLLIRVSGKLISNGYDEFIDDGSGFPLRIEFGPGTGYYDGDYIAVTGVSSVVWDGMHGFRVIMPRDYYDITKY